MMPIRRYASTRGRKSPETSPPRAAPRTMLKPNQWLPIMIDRVSADRIIIPVAALSPPTHAASASPWWPPASGSAITNRSGDTLPPNACRPASASGMPGMPISSRYSGNIQRAVFRCAGSRSSTTPTWN